MCSEKFTSSSEAEKKDTITNDKQQDFKVKVSVLPYENEDPHLAIIINSLRDMRGETITSRVEKIAKAYYSQFDNQEGNKEK